MGLFSKRVLALVENAGGMIVGNILDTEELKDLKHCLAAVCKRDGAVVRISLLDEYVAIESAHLGNREDTDTAEGAGCDGKYFALSDV